MKNINKKMKNKILQIFVLIICCLVFSNCNNSNDNATKEKDLDLQKRELDIKQKELDLKEKQLALYSAQKSKSSETPINVNSNSSNNQDRNKFIGTFSYIISPDNRQHTIRITFNQDGSYYYYVYEPSGQVTTFGKINVVTTDKGTTSSDKWNIGKWNINETNKTIIFDDRDEGRSRESYQINNDGSILIGPTVYTKVLLR
jgi:hypothetical protein